MNNEMKDKEAEWWRKMEMNKGSGRRWILKKT